MDIGLSVIRMLIPPLLALGGAASASAQAELGSRGKLSGLLPPLDGQKACFVRQYDPAHLKKHPQQKVTSLRFEIEYHRGHGYLFGMSARVRHPYRSLHAAGLCEDRGQKVRCGVECDGGEIFIEEIGRTGGLAVSFKDAKSYLRMTEGCVDDDRHWIVLRPQEDDWRFSLERAQPSLCKDMVLDQ